MLDHDTDPASLAGLEIVDRNGERIGRVRQVYPDGGALGWAGVRGNLIGTTEALVPLDRAQLKDDLITVPTTRARFLAAPRRTPDSTIDEEERTMLRRFYAETAGPERADEPVLDDAGATPEEPRTADQEPEHEHELPRSNEHESAPQPVRADRHAGAVPGDQQVVPQPRTEGGAGFTERSAAAPEPAVGTVDSAGPVGPFRAGAQPSPSIDTGSIDTGIDRSEGRLHVSTEPVPRTRVMLRKVVVTEQRTITVPVRREEFRVVREPIEDGAPVSDFVFADLEEEHVLHEERVIVRTEVVPVERIRLVREVLPEQHEVTGESWREQIVADEEPA